MQKGAETNRQKYGLLNYMESRLKKLYEKVNVSGKLDYKELTEVKDKINHIRNSILDGIKIRSRIEEQIEGEKLSHYLIN